MELEIPEGYELVSIPLHQVKHDRARCGFKRYEDGRETTFFAAAPDQFVKAFHDGNFVWAPLVGYSEHKNVRIVVVNLDNGMQIITDHDPRAVFGIEPGKETPARFYPDEALTKSVLVPCSVCDTLETWAEESYEERFESVWEALDRKMEILKERKRSTKLTRASESWILENCEVTPAAHYVEQYPAATWARVCSVEYTDVSETGYDLTVPGYETFMSADGVILSNTMALHVPIMDEAVKDAKEKLLPSQLLFSIRNRDNTLAVPKHESLLGLFGSQFRPSGVVHQFSTKQQALEGLSSGTVKLHDQVEIAELPAVATPPI